MEKRTIGSFIAALRKSQGMTQQELADRLCVSNKTVSKWECGESYPEITLIPVIAEIFGLTSDEILKGERASKESVPQEKGTAKAQLQIKRLIQSSMSRYKNLCWIAAALFLGGYIVLLVLSFAVNQPKAGFGVMSLLVVAGAILEVINFNRTYPVIMAEDIPETTPELVKTSIEVLLKGALNVFAVAAAVVLVSLPSLIEFGITWPAGVEELTSFRYYLFEARGLAVAAIALYWIAKWAVNGALLHKERFAGITLFPHNPKRTVLWLIISAACTVALLL